MNNKSYMSNAHLAIFLIPHKCDKCGKTFWLKKGWKYKRIHFSAGMGAWMVSEYICTGCIADESLAKEYAKKRNEYFLDLENRLLQAIGRGGI